METLGHARLGKWPLIGLMHWFVFVGFGALFFTLVTAYGQVFDPAFALPLIGHWPVYEWAAEIIAWLTGLGILTLIVVRQVNHPRSRGRRALRFFGSTFWQAYYVEVTILGVVVCVLVLRGLEYALAAAAGAGATRPGCTTRRRPGSAGSSTARAWPRWRTPSSSWPRSKIIVSMAWFITIALQPTMGVAWHRFLAFLNIWFKRHPAALRSGG